MEKSLQLKIFAKIHHDYNHYVAIQVFCDRIFLFRTAANICKKIPSQINSSLQYVAYESCPPFCR